MAYSGPPHFDEFNDGVIHPAWTNISTSGGASASEAGGFFVTTFGNGLDVNDRVRIDQFADDAFTPVLASETFEISVRFYLPPGPYDNPYTGFTPNDHGFHHFEFALWDDEINSWFGIDWAYASTSPGSTMTGHESQYIMYCGVYNEYDGVEANFGKAGAPNVNVVHSIADQNHNGWFTFRFTKDPIGGHRYFIRPDGGEWFETTPNQHGFPMTTYDLDLGGKGGWGWGFDLAFSQYNFGPIGPAYDSGPLYCDYVRGLGGLTTTSSTTSSTTSTTTTTGPPDTIYFEINDQMRRNVFGPLDEMGLVLDLKRLPGERNTEYRRRLFRVFTRKTDSTYQGLLNGITHELGLDFYDLMSIDFVGGPTDVGLQAGQTPQPRVVIKDGVLTLYGHYVGEDEFFIVQIDNKPQINLRKIEYREIPDLVTAINATGVFSATQLATLDGEDWSYTISNVDTNTWVNDEIVPSSTRFSLENSPLNEGLFFFGERRIFRTVKESESALSQPGDFYIDIDTGEVVTISLPSGAGRVRYQYRDIPKGLEASPVSISHIGSLEMSRYFFTQLELQYFDTPLQRFINNLPTTEAVEIINELYRASNNYWGT